MKREILFYFCLMFIFSFSISIFAKRPAPKKVEPVIFNGIEYRADHKYMGNVEAWDVESQQMLWRKKIYYIIYDENLEADVQDVFIKKIEVKNNCLIIINERNHKYELDLLTHKVRPLSSSFAPIFEKPTEHIAKGNTQFAFELYGKLAEAPGAEEKNLFFSPYSISTALALTYAGARGNTEKQMAQVLHFEPAGQRIHPAFGLLEKQLNEKGAEGVFELTVANALWGQKDCKFLDSFIDLVNSNYSAGLNEIDFADTENARNLINKWVEEKTREKIKDLIKPGILSRWTTLVLTNAIYFKGKWQYEFDKKDTRDADFHQTPAKQFKVPTMYTKKEFNYAEWDDLQIIEIGYKGDALSMIILLPRQVEGIKKLEKQLTIKNLSNWLGVLRKREVEVYLPKFTFTSEFHLNKVLSQMGMPNAFDDKENPNFTEKADFSGMAGSKDLFISAVLHKAFVEVNEEGTEAAAATAVVISRKSVSASATVFKADHPFIFMIKDNQTGSILFIGKIYDPSKK